MRVEVKLTQLDDSNWGTWHTRMKMLLTIEGLWAIVRDGLDEDPEQRDLDLNDKALAHIGSQLSDQYLHMYESTASAKYLWDSLESLFNQKNVARRVALRRELSGLKKLSGESISQYISRASKLRDDLRGADQDVTEDEVVMALLAGLPSQYATIVAIMETSSDPLEIDSCLSKLLTAENKISVTEAGQATAFVTHGSFSASHHSGAGTSSLKPKTCWYCGKPGHIKADCRKFQADKRKKNYKPVNRGVSFNTATAHLASTDAVTGVEVEDFVLDTGASFHMCPDRERFATYREAPPGVHFVTLADGSQAAVLGSGSVVCVTRVNGHLRTHKWPMLHVPALSHTLVSVSALSRKLGSFTMDISDSGCLLRGYSPEHKVMCSFAEADLAGGLFVIRGADPSGPKYVPKSAHMSASGVDVAGPAVSFSATATGGSDAQTDTDEAVPSAAAASSAAGQSSAAVLLHRRLNHLGFDSVSKMVSGSLATGLGVSLSAVKSAASDPVCPTCVQAKHARPAFPQSTSKSSAPLELIHMDVCGPYQEASLGGARYCCTFLDDFSKFSAVCTVAHKSDVIDEVKHVIALMENQTGRKVKVVRSDRGGEYVNNELSAFFKQKGIHHQLTAAYTPQQNGSAERLNRTLNDRVRAMLIEAGCDFDMWAEAMHNANYVRNRCVVSGRDKTPWELYMGQVPDLAHLRVFGSRAYVKVPDACRRKLDPKSQPGVFMGYDYQSKAYRVLLDATRQVVVSRDVVVDEQVMPASSDHVQPVSAKSTVLVDVASSNDDANINAGGGLLDQPGLSDEHSDSSSYSSLSLLRSRAFHLNLYGFDTTSFGCVYSELQPFHE
jgi:transposase InsO family protein